MCKLFWKIQTCIFFCSKEPFLLFFCTVFGCGSGNRTRSIAVYTWRFSLLSYDRHQIKLWPSPYWATTVTRLSYDRHPTELRPSPNWATTVTLLSYDRHPYWATTVTLIELRPSAIELRPSCKHVLHLQPKFKLMQSMWSIRTIVQLE
jgi:hypothetical protein